MAKILIADDSVAELIIFQKFLNVPTNPSHALGTISLRGTILPIVDKRPELARMLQAVPGQTVMITPRNRYPRHRNRNHVEKAVWQGH